MLNLKSVRIIHKTKYSQLFCMFSKLFQILLCVIAKTTSFLHFSINEHRLVRPANILNVFQLAISHPGMTKRKWEVYEMSQD